jgi:hypothetical protein
MKESIRVGFPHGLVFVSDPKGGRPPEPGADAASVWANSECLMIKCTHIQEGETDVALSSDVQDALPYEPIFDDMLNTPSGVVQVSTSAMDVLLESNVPSESMRVRVWTNHPKWADDILVLLG